VLAKSPFQAYLDIDDIIRVAKEAKVDAIHPGYGFLSENPDFADACAAAGIAFIGPKGDVMRTLGNKVAARAVAVAGVPVVPATGALPDDIEGAKANGPDGGLSADAQSQLGRWRAWHARHRNRSGPGPDDGTGQARSPGAFGNDEVYLEKLVRRARHVEVQVLGDQHGNLVHLFERDCSVQRRNQKVVERAHQRPTWMKPPARSCASRHCVWPARPTTATPAPSNICTMWTAASTTSSKSTRAFRSSTP
jgi:pyruvate carboxylase